MTGRDHMNQGAPVLHGRRILVVEDEYVLAQLVCDALEAAGAVVLGPVARVQRALELITRETAGLDAAILDIDLGGERSYAIADTLAGRGVRFVFTTGYAADAIAAPYEAYPRLEKPYDTADLLAALALTPFTGG